MSQSRELTNGDLARITDPYTQLSLKLQAACGLRREESIKIRPESADRGGRLVLAPSWTKGGRAREIPIRNEHQRQVLEEARHLAGRGSLIPKAFTYVQQLQRFKSQCMAAGIQHVHGHRHQYAQVRYRELTGCARELCCVPAIKCLSDQRAGSATAHNNLLSTIDQMCSCTFDLSGAVSWSDC